MPLLLRTAARLGAVPLLVLVLLFATLRQRGPFWLGTNSDPSYVYLLSALDLAEGVAPAHLGHPGLTVHLFGAAVLHIAHAAARPGRPLADDVLSRPDWYLGISAGVLVVLFAATLVLLGHAVHRVTGRWGFAWLAQLGVLLSPSAPFELTDFKPEPLLYVFGTLFAAVAAYASASDREGRAAPLLGILAGLGIATKWTALPLLVAAIVLLPARRSRLVCLVATGATAALCALPALTNWRYAASFLATLVRGPGLYGLAIDAAARPYAAQWARAAIEEAPFFVVLFFALVTLSSSRAAAGPSRFDRVIAALLAAALAQLALMAVHPYQPRYLVPALSLAGLLLAASATRAAALERPLARGAVLVLAAGLVSLAGNQVLRLVRRTTQLGAASSCQQQARSQAVASGCRIVTYYRASSPALALFQADGYAMRRYRERLARLWPDEAFLGATGEAVIFSGAADLASLARDQCLVAQGAPGGPVHPFAHADRPFDGVPALATARPVFACEWEAVVRADPPPPLR